MQRPSASGVWFDCLFSSSTFYCFLRFVSMLLCLYGFPGAAPVCLFFDSQRSPTANNVDLNKTDSWLHPASSSLMLPFMDNGANFFKCIRKHPEWVWCETVNRSVFFIVVVNGIRHLQHKHRRFIHYRHPRKAFCVSKSLSGCCWW